MDKTFLSILAGLGGMVGWGTSDFFANMSSGKIGHLKTFFWSQLIGLTCILFIIPLFGFSPVISLSSFFLLAICSVLYALGYLFFYKGFEIGNVSVISASMNLYSVFTMILAYIFLGQRLTHLQIFGIFWVIFGVILVSMNMRDFVNRKINLKLGVKEVIIASMFSGIFWNLSDLLSKSLGWLATTIFVKIGAILFLFLYSYLSRKNLKLPKNTNHLFSIVFLVGILEVFGVASVNFGLKIGDTILVTPIASSLTVVTVLLAMIFQKEKLSLLQTLGIVSVVSGIILTGIK
jgi:bacterial/archaeal transporter family protein